MMIGYARVSSAGQNLDAQITALMAAGCTEKLYEEKVSGTKRKGRAGLAEMLEFARKGDTVVVTRLDRLARSLSDLIKIGEELKRKGIALRVIEQPVDTTTPAGRLFFQMLGAFAEFETAIRADRQREGIDAAKARPESPYKGRPPSINSDRVRQLKEAGNGASAIAKELGIARSSVYRLLEEAA